MPSNAQARLVGSIGEEEVVFGAARLATRLTGLASARHDDVGLPFWWQADTQVGKEAYKTRIDTGWDQFPGT